VISNFYIDRPLFATVVSAFIVIAGIAAYRALPISLFPEILPPQVDVSTSYPGASADVVAETVAAPLEQAINGVENMLYVRSASSPAGTVTVSVTFAVGTDPDIAAINVQNRVQAAIPLLPEEVRRQGVTVRKTSTSFLLVVAMDSPDGRYDDLFVSNYALVNVLDELRRVPGVGAADAFGAREHAIRIWLKPDRLAELGLTPADVARAVREQNTQSAAGRLGDEPLDEKVDLTLTVTSQTRMSEPEEFENIVLKTGEAGEIVRLGDVSRIELGARDYAFNATRNGRPVIGIGVFLSPNANALDVAAAIKQRMAELAVDFPPGLRWNVPYDTSLYVEESMQEVVITLLEAMALVFIVVFVFLHNIRATLIPTLAVPVSLIGALAGMYLLGFTINSLTLFGMVLAIGIVVDDAIVVLENVERHMRSEHVDSKEATRRAMAEVTRPVIAIVLVLNAVFLPVAFLGGLVGEMYRQFAITIAVSVAISGFVALTLTPALCALFLKTGARDAPGILGTFERWFKRMTERYTHGVGWMLKRSALAALLLLAMFIVTGALIWRTPSSLAPDEDQGYVINIVSLPPAASLQRTKAVMRTLESQVEALPSFNDGISFAGLDVLTFQQRSNAGVAFAGLKDWSERGKGETAQAMTGQIFGIGMGIKDAFVFSINPPAISGLSTTGGFEGYVQSRVGSDYAALEAAAQKLAGAASQRPELTGVLTTFSAQVPRVKLEVDREKAKILGVSLDEINTALQSTFGALYVNDFNRRGRVYRVQLQSEGQYRAHPEDLRDVYVRSERGDMLPLTALARVVETTGPDVVERFNVFPAARIMGNPAPGRSSGEALEIMEQLADEHLPEGYSLAWGGQSFQEKTGSQNVLGLFGLAILMVFLILAAQYERLTLPLAVILAVPFAAFGAFLAVTLRGLYNDVYLQIGLVTLVGLAAKNAILIVEFASHKMRDEGLDARTAAVEAARLRFRPIIMTSLAFILGVTPLAVSSGAGAASRHSIGTGVIGGMLAATFLAVFFIPTFFVWTQWLSQRLSRRRRSIGGETPAPGG
jgi:multidrug efflux pump